MADIRKTAQSILDEAQDAIAWVAIWKTGRSWNAEAFYLKDYDVESGRIVFEDEDLPKVKEIVSIDDGAVLINGYYTNIGWSEVEDMTISTLADGIRFQYECKSVLLADFVPAEEIKQKTYPDTEDHRNIKLIKIDRNGSKHFEGYSKCDRCGGSGWYTWGAMIDGRPQYAGVCFKCNGGKWMPDKWIERTAEYEAKLAAKREERAEKIRAKYEAARAEREKIESERRAEQERIESERRAEKARSQYIGTVGQKIELQCKFVRTACYEAEPYIGYGTETVYINTFADADGNKIIWKTNSQNIGAQIEEGAQCVLKGTVKSHSEYKEEKQTVLIRCKIKAVA